MRIIKWISGITGAISLFVLLLTFAIQIPTFSIWFYRYEFQKNETYEQVNMTEPDLIAVTKHMLKYMQGKEERLNIETVVGGETRLFFSDIEVFHMKDVADLFAIGYTTQAIACVLFILASVFFLSPFSDLARSPARDARRLFLKCIFCAGLSILAAAVVLVVCIAVDFDNAFILFHEIFFTNDMWILDYDVDLLVNIVPTPFFIDIAAFIGILYAVFICSAVCVSYVGLRILKKEKDTLRINL